MIVIACTLPLLPGGFQGVASLPLLILPTVGLIFVMLRVGLLAYAVALVTSRWLVVSGLVLHDAWYLPSSAATLLLVLAVALYGFQWSLAGRPAFGGDERS